MRKYPALPAQPCQSGNDDECEDQPGHTFDIPEFLLERTILVEIELCFSACSTMLAPESNNGQEKVPLPERDTSGGRLIVAYRFP